jgi:mRNA-degrading endonuclease toxin of MazEF toxin-antitoxin module
MKRTRFLLPEHPPLGWLPRTGDVVRLDWPAVHVEGHEEHGHPFRPFLVLSAARRLRYPVAIACPITSRTGDGLRPHEVPISPTDVRIQGTEIGLDEAGIIQVYQLRVFDVSRRLVSVNGVWRLGAIVPRVRSEVEESLRELFGMDGKL